MDTPFLISSFKITTPLGGAYPYKQSMGVPPGAHESLVGFQKQNKYYGA